MHTKCKLLSCLLSLLLLLLPLSAFADVLTGQGQGLFGAVVVEVTTEDGKITDVTVKEHSETEGIGTLAVEQLPAKIVEAQSTSVDSITGATYTSDGIKQAVENALAGAVAQEAPALEDIAIDADAIIIGGGLSGMTSAIRATQLGAKVVLLEGTNRLGGCLYFAGGSISAAGYKIQKENGIEDTPDTYFNELVAMNGDYPVNQSMLRTYVDKAGWTLDWLDEYVGVDFGDRHVDGGGYQQTSNPRVTYALGKSAAGAGVGFYNACQAKIDELVAAGQVQVILNAYVTELIQKDGAVIGCKVGDKEYFAPNVVLATGGYGAGEEWLKKTIFTNVATSDPHTSDGSGLTLATSVGGQLGNMDYISPYTGAIPVDGFSCTLRANIRYPGAIWVDKHGDRLDDEKAAAMDSKRSGEIWVGKAEDNIVYVIISEGMIDKETALVNPAMGGAPLSNKGWDRFEEVLAEGKFIFKADTMEELGEKIGAENLAKTVAQYNTDAAAGADSVFGRTEELVAFENGPFYALYTIPWVLQSAGGVIINEKGQVLDEANAPIPGLYACGELIGSANVDGHVTVGGFIHSFTSTFGAIVGESIAESIAK